MPTIDIVCAFLNSSKNKEGDIFFNDYLSNNRSAKIWLFYNVKKFSDLLEWTLWAIYPGELFWLTNALDLTKHLHHLSHHSF